MSNGAVTWWMTTERVLFGISNPHVERREITGVGRER